MKLPAYWNRNVAFIYKKWKVVNEKWWANDYILYKCATIRSNYVNIWNNYKNPADATK